MKKCHNRAFERGLEPVTVKCRNRLCKETFHTNNKKLDHEKTCVYSHCSCPRGNCNYTGLPRSLYKHFGEAHRPSEFSFNTKKSVSLVSGKTQVFLQDSRQNTLFVLNRNVMYTGSFLSLTFVSHDSQKPCVFSYDLTVVIDKDTRVWIEAVVECMPKWTGKSGKCLVLPGDLVEGLAPLKLELVIRKRPFMHF